MEKAQWDPKFLIWARQATPEIIEPAMAGNEKALAVAPLGQYAWIAARATPIALPARTETLPTGDAFATERANGRNQVLKECAAMLKAQGFKVVGYE